MKDKLKKISKKLFILQLKKRNGDFRKCEFNFELDLNNIQDIDFELDFSKSVFKKKVFFSRTIFHKNFSIAKTIFEDEADFYNSIFKEYFNASNAIFRKKTLFNLVRFNSDTDFSKAFFNSTLYFKKARFLENASFHKTNFYMKADFSYCNFSKDSLTSFISVNEKNILDDKRQAPLFIFKNILFYSGTIFNEVDLSRATFQDSIIEDITFKECIFPKIDGRNAFYMEKAIQSELVVDTDFEKIVSEEFNTFIVDKGQPSSELCLLDRILIRDRHTMNNEIFFIVTKFYFSSANEAVREINKLNSNKHFVGVQDITSKVCMSADCNTEVVALRVKKFDVIKHWEVLEDLYRQMKKSLEDSHDWQMAGDFYKGEMNAKMKSLKSKEENFWYQKALWVYKQVSYFGESMKRILLMVFIFGNIGNLTLKIFKPEMGLVDILSKNISLFLPIFGNTTNTITNLNLLPYQETIIYIEIVWFYGLWLILAIAMRRRFRR